MSPPPANPPLVPPLFPLPPQIVPLLGLPVPPDPVQHLPLVAAGAGAVPVEKALLERDADLALLDDAGAQLLVQARGGEAAQRVVDVLGGLLGAPLALEGVRRQQQGLGAGARVGEAALERDEVRGEVDVLGERRRQGGGRGRQARGRGRGGVREGGQEGRGGEDLGEVLFSVCFVLMLLVGPRDSRKGEGGKGGTGKGKVKGKTNVRFILQKGGEPLLAWVGHRLRPRNLGLLRRGGEWGRLAACCFW